MKNRTAIFVATSIVISLSLIFVMAHGQPPPPSPPSKKGDEYISGDSRVFRDLETKLDEFVSTFFPSSKNTSRTSISVSLLGDDDDEKFNDTNLDSQVSSLLPLPYYPEVSVSNLRAFQIPEGLKKPISWPELDHPEIANRAPFAIIFEGGGTRSYIAAAGMVRALTDLGLMSKFRYLGGASGGGWFSAAYSFLRNDRFEPGWGFTASNDEEFLGDIVPPEDLTLEKLGEIQQKCIRRAVTRRPYATFFRKLAHDSGRFSSAFVAAVHEFYLKPAGIPKPFPRNGVPKLFTLNEMTALSAKNRNYELGAAGYEFHTQHPNRPLMTIGTTLLGPAQLVPFDALNRRYRVSEINPLYCGRGIVLNETYVSANEKKGNQTRLNGGAVESWAFMSFPPSAYNGPPDEYAQRWSLAGPTISSEPFTLSHAAAYGGYGIANTIASALGPIAPPVTKKFGVVRKYWSPSEAHDKDTSVYPPENPEQDIESKNRTNYEYNDFVFGDAGLSENAHLISLLRREELEGFVVGVHTSIPLNTSWNPHERPPAYTDIDDTISAYFGVFTDNPGSEYDFTANQVFEKSAYNDMANQLRESALAGTGIVADTTLKVIENERMGIKGGRTVRVLWFYLGRTYEWENRLPEETREAIAPNSQDNTNDLPSEDSSFPLFPNSPTMMLELSPENSNALADLTGWVVKKNKEKLFDILGN